MTAQPSHISYLITHISYLITYNSYLISHLLFLALKPLLPTYCVLPSDPKIRTFDGICARTAGPLAFTNPPVESKISEAKPGATKSVAAMRLNPGVPKFPNFHICAHISRTTGTTGTRATIVYGAFRPIPASQAPSLFARGRRDHRHSQPGVPLPSTPGYKNSTALRLNPGVAFISILAY